MNKERLMKILLAPVVSEKSAAAADAARQFTFVVTNDATKPEIAKAVELVFEVNVTDVRVMNVKGKHKRHGQKMGKRKNWKKASVRLQEGQDIDFSAAI